jgi:hypothetical protein
MLPCSMFIQQAKAMSPDLAGVNSITTGSFSGSARLMFREGNTTSVPHVLSVVRTNLMRAGIPARSVTFTGSYPYSLTTTFAGWTVSLLRPTVDDADVAFAVAELAAGLRPRRSRSALTKKLPSLTTTSPG